MGQAASAEAGPGLHRAIQRVRRLRRSRPAAEDLRCAAARHHRGVLPALAAPAPAAAGGRRPAGWWWELSMAQVEVSRTIVFTQPRYARGFFDALVADNLDLGRPDTIEIIFDRQVRSSTEGEFRTNVITRGTEVTVNAFYKHSRIKQYLKDGRALRIETVVNAPGDLGCQRRLHNLDELQARARAVNARLLQTERAGQACVL